MMRYLVIEANHTLMGHTIEGSMDNGWCGEIICTPEGGEGAGAVEEKYVIQLGATDKDKKRYFESLNTLRNQLTHHQTNDPAPPHGQKCQVCESMNRTIQAVEKHKRWFE